MVASRGRVVTLARVVSVARDLLEETGGLDLAELAGRCAVSRATLYRVVGSRDRLLVEVVWMMCRDLFERVRAEAAGDGADRVVDATRRFMHHQRRSASFSRFVRDEPELAARILFGVDGVHPRTVAMQREVLAEAGLGPAERLDDVAHLYVRVVESSLFAELLHGAPLEDSTVEQATRALLAQLLDPV